MMRNAREEVLEMLRDMDDYELVAIHNEYCDEVNYVDDRIYSMGEFDELYCMDGKSPLDVIRDAFNGSFNPNDDWFRWNGYGNLESTDRPEDWMDLDDIADYIVENDEDFDNDDLRDLMDEIEEENEEEEEEEEE